jgi:hypothetical protein
LEDGTLDKSALAKVAEEHFENFVVGIPSGLVTFPLRGVRQEWIAEETADKANDYVLYRKTSVIKGHTIANAVTHFIRLRAAAVDPQPRFMAVTLSFIATGTCELVP